MARLPQGPAPRAGLGASGPFTGGPLPEGTRGGPTSTKDIEASVNPHLLALAPAGRLAHCREAWRLLTHDAWVLQTIQGYKLEFTQVPPIQESHSVPTRGHSNQVCEAVSELVKKGAVSQVSPSEVKFLSPFFVVPKKGNKVRPILDLRQLNESVEQNHFKMEGWHSVRDLIQQGDSMIRIDLKDAYLSVPICRQDRPWLGFQEGDRVYRWNVLPFGLRSAPRVFTKLLKPVAAYLRSKGLRIVMFLDDILVMDQSPSLLANQGCLIVNLLQNLGFAVNLEKSVLTPAQDLLFLGLSIDSRRLTLELPGEKLANLLDHLQQRLEQQRITARQVASLAGQLNACLMVLPEGSFYIRNLQTDLRRALQRGTYTTTLTLSRDTRQDLAWWIRALRKTPRGQIKTPPVVQTIQSDSSLQGWGACSEGWTIGHHWTPLQSTWHINVLELMAAFLALQALAKNVSRGSILLELDNTAAVAAINRRGSSCSPQLTRIAHELWSWCWARGISVRAQHIPGHMNTEADQASRRVMDASSWKLCPFTFSRVNCLWGPVHTDLFADFSNHQVRHYYSWKPDPQAAAVDALSQDWTGQGLYAFPPFSLVSRCIAKLQTSNSPLILVAPVWPSQPWYASLLHHSFEEPRLLPQSHDLLRSHDGQVHPMLSTGSLTLAAWRLTNSSKHIANFRSRLHTSLRHHGGGEHSSPTPLAGAGGNAGAIQGLLIPFLPL